MEFQFAFRARLRIRHDQVPVVLRLESTRNNICHSCSSHHFIVHEQIIRIFEVDIRTADWGYAQAFAFDLRGKRVGLIELPAVAFGV